MPNRTVRDIGEFGLIRLMQEILGPPSENVLVGLGDDTATLPPSAAPMVITTDTMVEDIHFRTEWGSASGVAHKALASNLSDLASKCARPAFYVVSLGLPSGTPVVWVEELYREWKRLGAEWSVELVGGDTVRSEKILITLTAWGFQTTPEPVRLGGARSGDLLIVTGTLGDSAAGLETLLQKQALPDPYLLDRFHRPSPRHREALRIAQIALPSAMTDISDGLARDLPKLCAASGVGAQLDPAAFPCSPALRRQAGGRAPEYAWQGGEDYELLFTLPPSDWDTLRGNWPSEDCPLACIGKAAPADSGIVILGWEGKDFSGFDHFKS